GRTAADRETGEVDRDVVRRDHQTIGPAAGAGEIVDEFIRARLTDRLACLDLDRFSRASLGREDYRSDGEHNCKKRCWSSHDVLPCECALTFRGADADKAESSVIKSTRF